jgi:hypothetical protein
MTHAQEKMVLYEEKTLPDMEKITPQEIFNLKA